MNNKLSEALGASNPRAAQAIVPRLIALFHPASVMDYGCGSGTWVEEFRRLGVKADGVDLKPPPGSGYGILDLRLGFPKPVADMALCLEVAEHLPEDRAHALVSSLCRSRVVVFSAAIPFQGGWGHVNEQWPDYWAHKFAKLGYECSEQLREEIWSDTSIAWWYRQNLLIFASPETLKEMSKLPCYLVKTSLPARLVHPALWEKPGLMSIASRMRPLCATAFWIGAVWLMVFYLWRYL